MNKIKKYVQIEIFNVVRFLHNYISLKTKIYIEMYVSKVPLDFSYTPKKINPPIEIHVTLGTIPANKLKIKELIVNYNLKLYFYEYFFLKITDPFIPLAEYMCNKTLNIDKCFEFTADSIILVFATSKGVVIVAAILPARAPQMAPSTGKIFFCV